nr:MAG TPA: hypothetical protein [Caudoviricetes sp.]
MAVSKRQFAPVPGDPINIRRRHEFYITAVCVENLGQYDCQQCVLNQFPDLCNRCLCSPSQREDGKSIIYKTVDNDN